MEINKRNFLLFHFLGFIINPSKIGRRELPREMKILVEYKKNISHSEDDEIIYEDTKSSLESSWDVLGNAYVNEAEIQHQEIMKEMEVWKLVDTARAEMEVGHESLALIEKGVLSKVKIKTVEEEKPPILKLKCLDDLIKIFEKTAEVLESTLQEEDSLSKEEDDSLSVFKEIPLCCRIKYGIIDLEGSLPSIAIKLEENENVYMFGDFEIFIYEGSTNKSNPLCEYVLNCLDHGYSLDDLLKRIQHCVALYIGRRILDAPEIIDGFFEEIEETIYFIKHNDILEIKIRKNGIFVIILNGEHIKKVSHNPSLLFVSP